MINTDECCYPCKDPTTLYKFKEGKNSQNFLPLKDCLGHPFVPVRYRIFLVGCLETTSLSQCANIPNILNIYRLWETYELMSHRIGPVQLYLRTQLVLP